MKNYKDALIEVAKDVVSLFVIEVFAIVFLFGAIKMFQNYLNIGGIF